MILNSIFSLFSLPKNCWVYVFAIILYLQITPRYYENIIMNNSMAILQLSRYVCMCILMYMHVHANIWTIFIFRRQFKEWTGYIRNIGKCPIALFCFYNSSELFLCLKTHYQISGAARISVRGNTLGGSAS